MDLIKKREEFNIIFLDVAIPNFSGLKIFEYINQNYPNLSGRVVFITGGALDKETEKFLSNVNNAKLEKPFDLEGTN